MRVEQGRPDGWRLQWSETQIVPEKKTGSYPRESGLIELSVQLLADEKLRTFCTSAQQRMRRSRDEEATYRFKLSDRPAAAEGKLALPDRDWRVPSILRCGGKVQEGRHWGFVIKRTRTRHQHAASVCNNGDGH